MASNKAVIALVATTEQAEAAVADLQQAGFSSSDISALYADKRGTRDFEIRNNTKAPEGAATGATTLGVIGGTLGLLAGIGALAIPGLGPFIAAGPIMATLSGAAAGATVGSIGGALIGLGIPEIEAKQYEDKLTTAGNILLSVHTEDAAERARAKEILAKHRATDIKNAG